MLARLKGRDAGEGAAAAAEPEPEPEPELAPPAEGSYQLFVHVIGATKLAARDSTGESDPVVKCTLLSTGQRQITETRNKTLNPIFCLLYTSPSPRDQRGSRMPSSA